MYRFTSLLLSIVFGCSVFGGSLYGQNTLADPAVYRERLYISTDKESYIAGESVWLSVYCYDAAARRLSDLSNVVYLELQDAQKPVLQIKAALLNGRGNTMFSLPATLPTGNYRMVAYTRYMQNEGAAVFFTKVISVYNTLSAEKVVQEEGFVAQEIQPEVRMTGHKRMEGVQVAIDGNTRDFLPRTAVPIVVTNI